MDRGVQEHYWTNYSDQGRSKEVVYKPYTDGIDGEQFFQCLICLCVIYFVARMFFDGIVVFLIVGLSVGLIMQLLHGWSASIRPPKELVYKPIVHACGHIFCFWCAYQLVNPATRSECPRCRRPYLHIPRVCKALHLLLQRVELEEYKARTENFQELEARSGTFSSSLEDDPGDSESFMEFLRKWYASTNESMGMSRPSTESFDENGIHTPRSPQLTTSPILLGHQEEENQAGEVVEQQVGESSSPLEYDLETEEASDSRSTSEESWMRVLESFKNDIFFPDSLVSLVAGSTSTWDSEVGGYLTGGEFEDTSDQSELDEFNIMIDLLCPHCDKLLYRPIVLNCGHVPRGAILKCPSCKRHQPGLLPQVCEELDAYLGNAFPLEYNGQAGTYERAGNSSQTLNPVNIIKKGLDICTRRHQQLVAINTALVCDWFPDHTRKHPQRIVENIGPGLRGPLHYGIVCDGCGMVPIIGRRFECLDCTKEFGFDLCETCHLSGFDLTGHVNQEHTSDHRMEEWKKWTNKGGVSRNQNSLQGSCLALHCAREAMQAELGHL